MLIHARLCYFVAMAILATGCTTVYVPFEGKVRRRNLAIEYYTLGDGYAEQAKYDKALHCYQMALYDKALYDMAYYKIGLCLSLTSSYDMADKIFTRLLSKDAKNMNILLALAYVRVMNGKPKDALAIYEKVLARDYSLLEARRNYISLLINEGESIEARVQYDDFRRRYPDDESILGFEELLRAFEPTPPYVEEDDIDAPSVKASEDGKAIGDGGKEH